MRKFNCTGRKRILRKDVTITLHGEPIDPPIIDVDMNLDGYGFPSDANVILEAQRKTRFTRIDLGKVSNSIRRYYLSLAGFDDALQLVLRVKVVELSSGKLPGIANRLALQDKAGQIDRNKTTYSL